MRAGQPADQRSDEAAEALQALCQAYWYPAYAYARRCGKSREDAEDMTQAFFAEQFQKSCLSKADPARGRFRSYFLGSFKFFMFNAHRKKKAAKRGSQFEHLSLDFQSGEERFEKSLPAAPSPDEGFVQDWCENVMELALKRLEDEYAAEENAVPFAVLKAHLPGGAHSEKVTYKHIAEEYGLSESAVKMRVLRKKERYRELLRFEVAQTLDEVAEVDEELGELLDAWVKAGAK